MAWEVEIVHIPGTPPSSREQTTVDVIAAVIEPKLGNSLVRKLCQMCPLENLRHVKRVRKRSVDGKGDLSVILCVANGREMEGIPDDVLQLISHHELIPFVAQVAKYAASSKEEWEEQCKLWPTSYHPHANLNAVAGFSEDDSQSILDYMKMAIQLAKSSYLGEKVVNAAIIADPKSRQIIASAFDQTCLLPAPINKTSSCLQETSTALSCKSDTSAPLDHIDTCQKPSLNKCIHLYDGVSCLYPWRWTEQSMHSPSSSVTCGSNYSWHPLRHAALVAIENAAARDRKLFPSSGSLSGEIFHMNGLQRSTASVSAKRQKTEILENVDNLITNIDDGYSDAMRPYLCTGFDMYLVWEPCTLCAMALVHQRIRRIFFAFPNPNAGALGSVHRLQGEKSLNHHYTVFRVLLSEEALDEVKLPSSDKCLLPV